MGRGWCLLNPQSHTVFVWEYVTVNLLVFTALVTPYEVAFQVADRSLDFILEGGDALFWANRLVDVLFLLDVVLHFNTMKFYAGILLDTRWKIARHYVRGWFLVDVVSLVPFDLVGIALGSSSVSQLRIFRVVRLLRLIKLVRLVRTNALMDRWKAHMSFSYRRRTLYTMIGAVMVTIHWIACCVGFLGNIQGVPCGQLDEATDCVVTWFSEWIAQLAVQGKAWSPERAYLLSLHVATSMVVHPHTRSPMNETEQLVLVILMLWGGWTWTKVISRSTAVATSIDRHSIAYHQTMDDLNAYCTEKEVCPELRARLRTYFNNKQGFSVDDTHKQLCAKMSPCLQSSVAYAINKAWLLRVPYLAKATRPFVVKISYSLTTQCFAQNESWGDIFKLYILRKGLATLGVSKMRLMRPGSVWGEEHMLLTDKKLLSPNTAKALSFVDTSCLDRASFERVLGDYPDNLKAVRRYYVLLAMIRGVIFQSRSRQQDAGRAMQETGSKVQAEQSQLQHNEHVQHHAAMSRSVQRIEFNNQGDFFSPVVSAPPATMEAVRKVEDREALRSMEDRLMKRLDSIGDAVQGQVSSMGERLVGLEARLHTMESTLCCELPQLRASIQDVKGSRPPPGWCASPRALPHPGGEGAAAPRAPQPPPAFDLKTLGATDSFPLNGQWLQSCSVNKKSAS